MKRIKLLLIFLFTVIFLVVLYKLQDTKIIKLQNPYISDDRKEYFVVQNPPKEDSNLVKMVYEFNKVPRKSEIQVFYKETFWLNRFYKPYKILWYNYDIFKTPEIFHEYGLIQFVTTNFKLRYSEANEISHLEKINLPYFRFYDFNRFEYYPNGTVNDSNFRGDDPFIKSVQEKDQRVLPVLQ